MTELLDGYGANTSQLMKERRVVMDIVELLNPLKLFQGVVCGSVVLEKKGKKPPLPFTCTWKHLSHSCGSP